MSTKELSLFTLELCIQKKTVKLRVHQTDTLNDLLFKLVSKINLPQKYIEKVRQKLEAGLQSMAENPTCSSKVQNKLQSLTKECQIVILGVSESDPVGPSLNETPFNILLETPGKLRKGSTEHAKRNYLQSGQGSPALKRNYNLPISQIRCQRQNSQNYESYPSHKNTATFSGIPYKQTSSNFQSPQKCFKRYGPNSEQKVDPYGFSFGNVNNANGYQICYERRQKSGVETQVNRMDYGLHQLDNRPFSKKSNQRREGYRFQTDKNQCYSSKQSYIQYPNKDYGKHQPNSSVADQLSKIHIPQQSSNVFGGRSPEDSYGKVSKKFSYLQSSQF